MGYPHGLTLRLLGTNGLAYFVTKKKVFCQICLVKSKQHVLKKFLEIDTTLWSSLTYGATTLVIIAHCLTTFSITIT